MRGQPAAVRIRSRRIRRLRRQDAGANVGAADGPKGEAQDVPSNPGWFSLSHHHQKNKTPHLGAFCSSGGESGIRTHGRFDPSPVFKTGAFNRSAISPCFFAYARRAARATTPVLLRASCPSPLRGQRLRRCSLRLPACASRPGPSTARPSLRNLLLVAKRGCAVYQECCAGRPGLPFFDSASRQPKRIASGIIAPNSGSSSTGSRITIGASCVALA
jgi:hypothetical protein